MTAKCVTENQILQNLFEQAQDICFGRWMKARSYTEQKGKAELARESRDDLYKRLYYIFAYQIRNPNLSNEMISINDK